MHTHEAEKQLTVVRRATSRPPEVPARHAVQRALASVDTEALTPASIGHLQRTAGNAAVASLLKRDDAARQPDEPAAAQPAEVQREAGAQQEPDVQGAFVQRESAVGEGEKQEEEEVPAS